MTPKEKAQEIFDNMCQTISSDCEHDSYCSRKECTWKGITYCIVSKNEAKQCALNACEIAVTDLAFVIPKEAFDFWISVKAEIEKL